MTCNSEQQAGIVREHFEGSVPADRWYDTTHDMWVKGDEREITVGATAYGIFLAGNVIAFTAKPAGATIELGRGLGVVECAKTVLAVHSPLSMQLDVANADAEEHPHLINRDPYTAGWMARGKPTNWAAERLNLVDAAGYAEHVRAADRRAIVTVMP